MSDERPYQSPDITDPIELVDSHEPPDLPEPPALPEPMGFPQPRVWTVFVSFFLSLVLYLGVSVIFLLGSAILIAGQSVLIRPDLESVIFQVTTSHVGFFGMLLCSVMVFLIMALTAAYLSPVPISKRLRLGSSGLSILGVTLAIFGTLAIGLFFDGLLELKLLPESPALKMFADTIVGMRGMTALLAVFLIGFGPGIAEELMFRGYIQTRLTQRWGPLIAVMVTAVLFGVMHFDLIHGIFAFFMGLFLGFLTEKTGSIRPAIICHTVNNATSTLSTNAGVEIVGTSASLIALCLAVVVMILAIGYLHFIRPPGTPSTESPALLDDANLPF